MNFDCKCYLLKDGIMTPLYITRELLEKLQIDLTEEQIKMFLEKNKNHYLLLEFYCDALEIEHKGEECFYSPTSYSEYLNGLLCDHGYITFMVIDNYQDNNFALSSKAKNRYDRSEKSVLLHVPYKLDEISEYDISYLNHIESDLEQLESIYIYSQKQKWNGKYKMGKEYNLHEFYSKLNAVNKKTR